MKRYSIANRDVPAIAGAASRRAKVAAISTILDGVSLHYYIEGMIKQISIGFAPSALVWLQRESKRLGISIGELVRRLIDQARDSK